MSRTPRNVIDIRIVRPVKACKGQKTVAVTSAIQNHGSKPMTQKTIYKYSTRALSEKRTKCTTLKLGLSCPYNLVLGEITTCEYSCQENYVALHKGTLKCVNGLWDNEPTCLPDPNLMADDMDKPKSVNT